MAPPFATPAPLLRAAAVGRPAADPGCAGCSLLGALRALRRVGLDVVGAPGCERGGGPPPATRAGRWAAVVGARRVLASGGEVVAAARSAGARLVVLADRDGDAARRAAEVLARATGGAAPLDGADLAGSEATARDAAGRGVALVALSPCVRGGARAAPLAIAPARCNRCGACLSLACAAISDRGGEALVVDPDVCTGCGLCAPLCRARAIG